MIASIVIFAVAYVLMLVFSKFRPIIAIFAGLIFCFSGLLPLDQITDTIDFNVLLMLIGTMGLVSLFIESKMPSLLADHLMSKVPNVMWAAVALALFSGIISAFVDNVATVLMVAPVGIAICKKLDTNPVPFIIAIAVSSNLQGAATLVGDTTAIMLGSAMDMSFLDFIWYQNKPSIFFAVELGALLSAFIVMFIFRKEKKPIPDLGQKTVVTDYVPSILLVIMLILLIGISFVPEKPSVTNGIICCALFVIGLIYKLIKTKDIKTLLPILKDIDISTLGILFGLFLMIGGLTAQGVIDKLAGLLAKVGGGNVFVLYTVIVWASVLISAVIDNIPYVATMIPVIMGLAGNLAVDPTPLLFGLLSGATLGGNITPVGASANIAGIGILRKEGYGVKNKDFFKIGIPFTLAAIIPAYIYIWLVYGNWF